MSMINYLTRSGKPDLAYCHTPAVNQASLPTVVFCGGYRSDMDGTKATWLEEQAKKRGQGFLRFDYSGHGRSGGDFNDMTIGDWKQDALDIIAHTLPGQPIVVVGSSMGGWIGLLVLLALPKQVKGFVGIAAAPDFTRAMYDELNDDQRAELDKKGVISIPNDYSDEPYIIKKSFIEESVNHSCVHTPNTQITAPIILLQGMCDKDVLWPTTIRIVEAFPGADVCPVLIEDGDHRLSRPQDLPLIDQAIQTLSNGASFQPDTGYRSIVIPAQTA